MDFLDKMKDSFSNATDSFKMNNQIKENEKKIQDLLYQVGVQCYNTHGTEEGTEYDRLFSEICRLQQENMITQANIQALSAGKVCAKCGFENTQDAKFCVGCGAPLDVVKVEPDGGNATVSCPRCGAQVEADAGFCTACGNKMQ